MFVTCYSEYYLTRWQPTKNRLHRPLSLQDKVYQSPRLLFFSIAKRPLSFFGFSEQRISISFLVSHIIVKHHLYASFLEAHCSCILMVCMKEWLVAVCSRGRRVIPLAKKMKVWSWSNLQVNIKMKPVGWGHYDTLPVPDRPILLLV